MGQIPSVIAWRSISAASNFLLMISASYRPGGSCDTYWRKWCCSAMYYRGGSIRFIISKCGINYLHGMVLFLIEMVDIIFVGRLRVSGWCPGQVHIWGLREDLLRCFDICDAFDNVKMRESCIFWSQWQPRVSVGSIKLKNNNFWYCLTVYKVWDGVIL